MISPDFALVSRVERTVRQQRLFRSGDTLVVALSGGADSTALLDLLTRLPDYNLHLVVAHLNHCLRGAEADADEEFCRGAAARYDIPFESRRVDVRMAASEKRLNLEDAGRRARIEFFAEIGVKYGAATVALAHHADDQAETVLMRLLRGSGMTGLSGMAYRNARGYVRPLLDITRSEIEQYLNMRGLDWREDASNSDTIYLRNRIRHELLPLLETYNPAIRSCLAATASIIGGDEALLEELTERTFGESCRAGEGRVVCRIAQLRTLNPALRRRVLRHAFKKLNGSLEGVGVCHVDAISDLVDSDRPNSRLSLPQGVAVVREYDDLVFMHADGSAGETGFELLIAEPGIYQLPFGGSIVVELTNRPTLSSDSCAACFDLGKTPFPWLVRNFHPGDRMMPFGMSGRKKIKDIFIDRKIPLSERKRIPLLFCGGDLVWIAGVCASELSRTDANFTAAVRVMWRNKTDKNG
ncbi:MAG: tRNA lysidine(34) synthetase TilS [Desulfuromonadaceae bacterium]|nr:tRNA lysidine(34) synthetase TilS [Desulfuromonadaceae bacterium]